MVHDLICSADSVAHPQIQNTKQFNGDMVVTSASIKAEVRIHILVQKNSL